ncbi:APC family permease [Glaciihabitans arcticus]|uniref:APC family permease n=1 Tax=Glaciihabitans arcticus TaxID=2668039 RepID=UPI0023D94855|nr:APC family permease [Glaciihabitans arcticus]
MTSLDRRLGTRDAVFLGLGSMLGAGVFAAFTPAAQAAGSGLLVGLVIAAIVAFCNATSSAQLAAVYPTSGGTYVYGRERLGEWWGFVAGWSFVVGKTASCAAMALTFAAYAAPAGWERPLAAIAVVVLGIVNYRGIAKTAALTRVIVVIVLLVLAVAVASAVPAVSFQHELFSSGPYGILQSAGLLFFAFAGYARIATLGEEVRNPARTIPRAILIALGITVLVYAAVAVVLLGSLGAGGIAGDAAPLAASAVGQFAWAAPVVRAGAAIAALGALLGLMAGIGRTSLAMARERDLPGWLAGVHPEYRSPYRAELLLTVVVVVLVLTLDLRGAIGFSSFGVLVYYFVANVAALSQPAADRRYPRVIAALGGVLCAVLAATLPWPSIAGGVLVLVAGVVYRLIRLRASS